MVIYVRDAYNYNYSTLSSPNWLISIMLKPPPIKLARLLEIVNLVPPSNEIPDLEKAVESLINEAEIDFIGLSERRIERLVEVKSDGVKGKSFNPLTIEKALHKCLEVLPVEFRDYVLKKTPSRNFVESLNPIGEAIRRYNFARNARATLRRLARIASLSAEQRKVREWFYPLVISNNMPRLEVQINEKGLITVERDFFAEAIEEVEAGRIRECQNRSCKRLFWAGRANQSGCNPKCSNASRNQSYRKRYRNSKDSYKSRKLESNERAKAKRKGD